MSVKERKLLEFPALKASGVGRDQKRAEFSTLQQVMEEANTSLYCLGGTKESAPGLGQGVHGRVSLLGRSAQVDVETHVTFNDS